MGQIVKFPTREEITALGSRASKYGEDAQAVDAEILLFTGVQYERHDESVSIARYSIDADEAFETTSQKA